LGTPVWEQRPQIEDAIPASPNGGTDALPTLIWGLLVEMLLQTGETSEHLVQTTH
jgi:hypothetical protein